MVKFLSTVFKKVTLLHASAATAVTSQPVTSQSRNNWTAVSEISRDVFSELNKHSSSEHIFTVFVHSFCFLVSLVSLVHTLGYCQRRPKQSMYSFHIFNVDQNSFFGLSKIPRDGIIQKLRFDQLQSIIRDFSVCTA